MKSNRRSKTCLRCFTCGILAVSGSVPAEPVVVRGEQVPLLLGIPVNNIRLCDRTGKPLPVQVDEVTDENEYVCDRGEEANGPAGNGILDAQDEIVFMYEDCTPCPGRDDERKNGADGAASGRIPVRVRSGSLCREAYLSGDASHPVCTLAYLSYDHSTQQLTTPWYYARFAPDRFHFVNAGIRTPEGDGWVDLTRELRIEILIRALWGLLAVHYTEDNLVCYVKRYKAGPIRLIRRGDLHLRIGAGIRGGRAAVNQLCYPTMVSVPVSIHLPVRFRNFFREAYLEMTPVVDHGGKEYTFSVPGCGVDQAIEGTGRVDTLYPCVLNSHPFTLLRGSQGLGWIVRSDIPDSSGVESGFIFHRPSQRGGLSDCGYRLMIRDVPRGRYTVTNRVLFTRPGSGDIGSEFKMLIDRASVRCGNRTTVNRLTDVLVPVSKGRGSRENP